MKWTDNKIDIIVELCEEEKQIAIDDQKHADFSDIDYYIGIEDACSIVAGIKDRYLNSDISPKDYFEGFVEQMSTLLDRIYEEIICNEKDDDYE